MTPSFQEAPISQIPALRFLQQLGYSYLSPEDVAVERKGPGEVSGDCEGRFSSVFPCLEPAMGGANVSVFRRGIAIFEGLFISQIPRIGAYGFRTMCEITLNISATPLHDAHQGGCFMHRSRQEGGRP